MASLVSEHGIQCMLCAAKFLMTLQTDILLTETSDFLKQIIILKSVISLVQLNTGFRCQIKLTSTEQDVFR